MILLAMTVPAGGVFEMRTEAAVQRIGWLPPVDIPDQARKQANLGRNSPPLDRRIS
jgi:hypothetical protein